jgi:phosphohistidine phosphatase
MDLILWRHCDAESGVPDDLRRLTATGRHQARRMAQWLGPRLPPDCRVLVSPAVRAQQTVEALERDYETVPAIGAGAGVASVLRVAGWPDAPTAALIVGHEPTLGCVVGHLLTGDDGGRPLDKGAVVWLSSDGATGQAVIVVATRPALLVP